MSTAAGQLGFDPRGVGFSGRRIIVHRKLIAVACTIVIAPLGACGDDGDESDAAQAPDPERYCQLASELDAAGEAIFKELEGNPDATPEDFVKAERQLVQENADLFEELEAVAPEEIEGDVSTLLAGLRVRAGLSDDGPPSDEVAAAEKAVSSYEKEACGAE